jgi:hypothetical protein
MPHKSGGKFRYILSFDFPMFGHQQQQQQQHPEGTTLFLSLGLLEMAQQLHTRTSSRSRTSVLGVRMEKTKNTPEPSSFFRLLAPSSYTVFKFFLHQNLSSLSARTGAVMKRGISTIFGDVNPSVNSVYLTAVLHPIAFLLTY